MVTYTATRAGANKPVASHGYGGNRKTAWGSIDLTAGLAAGDIVQMCRVPKGAVIVGGRVFGDKMELSTSGAALDIDVGTDTTSAASLGNLGVWHAGPITGYKPEGGYNMPLGGLLLTDGPQTMSTESIVQLTCVTSAASFTAGTVNLTVEYLVP